MAANRSCVLFARCIRPNVMALEWQIALLKNYANEHRITCVEVICDCSNVYTSITKLLAEKQRLNSQTILLVTHLTRLGRDTRELVKRITELFTAGVEVIAVCETDQLPKPSDASISPQNNS